MPIDIDQFEETTEEQLTEPTNAERVVRYLVAHRDKAFTPSEIAEGAGVKKSSISTVLRRLEERALVRHKGDYWAIGDLDRVRDAFTFHQVMEGLDDGVGEEDLSEWREHAVGDGAE